QPRLPTRGPPPAAPPTSRPPGPRPRTMTCTNDDVASFCPPGPQPGMLPAPRDAAVSLLVTVQPPPRFRLDRSGPKTKPAGRCAGPRAAGGDGGHRGHSPVNFLGRVVEIEAEAAAGGRGQFECVMGERRAMAAGA